MTISEVLKHLAIPFRAYGEHEHTTQGWINLDCPFCGFKNHYRLGYNLRYGYCNCWSCGPKNLASVIMEVSKLSYGEIKALLGDLERSVVPAELPKKGKLRPPTGLGGLKQIHLNYLKGRNYDPKELVAMWGIQATGVTSNYPWRLFIPIHYHGQVVSWTTRSVNKKTTHRYLSAGKNDELISHRSLLYGEDYTRNCAIVCEGPFDVWRVGPGAVCTCGTSFTRAQVLRMAKFPVRVVCFDAEDTAQNQAHKLCRMLEVFPGETTNVVLESGKDPSAAKEEEIQELRERFLL